jgi:hypothetical protein
MDSPSRGLVQPLDRARMGEQSAGPACQTRLPRQIFHKRFRVSDRAALVRKGEDTGQLTYATR